MATVKKTEKIASNASDYIGFVVVVVETWFLCVTLVILKFCGNLVGLPLRNPSVSAS